MEENKVAPEEVEVVEELEQEIDKTLESEIENETVEVEEEKVDHQENDYLDRLQRLMAEFDNYRKRTEKEKQSIYDLAVSDTVTDLLGMVDNFERALKQNCEDKAFYEGVSMIYKQLMGALEKHNVTAIQAEGKEFDPAFHNAIFHIEDETLGTNVVAEELQKGYMYKEKVIRHSLVKVAN